MEIMISVTVMGLLLTGVLAFYIQNVKGIYASEQRLKLAGQIKRFSDELIVNGSRANQFIIFKSTTAADFDGTNTAPTSDNSDRQTIPGASKGAAAGKHPAGDFVVFVYYEIPKPAAQPLHRITRLVGYYLAADPTTGVGPVRRISVDLSASPSTSSVEAILTANWSTATFTTYFPVVRGLAVPEHVDNVFPVTPTPGARLFYMNEARNVIVSGQIYSSNKNVLTNTASTFTNSFNFTITPRT